MPDRLLINVFNVDAALAAGRAKGIFAAHGLEVDVKVTPNSTEQMRGLGKGSWQIVSTAFDNVLGWAGGKPLGDAAEFLKDGMKVTVDMIEGSPVAVHLPQSTVCEVVEADAVVKGQTASSSYKPAKLDNGVRIMVPPFISAGERVVVNIEERSYVERAKD